jgi:hypothetical protein
VKTFSDLRPDAPKKVEEGWGSSNLDHVDPGTSPAGTVRAERPTVDAADAPAAEQSLKKIESIPAPAAKEPVVAPQVPTESAPHAVPQQSPTVAPPGPAVYPPPPASDPRDVPAAETSGRSLTGRHGHTT